MQSFSPRSAEVGCESEWTVAIWRGGALPIIHILIGVDAAVHSLALASSSINTLQQVT